MACVFPFAQSLSIPPTPSTVVVQEDNDTDTITSTLTPINKEDGEFGLVFTGDDDQSQDALEQSTGLGTKDSKRHVPSDAQPISQQSLEGTSTDDTNKIEATTESDVSGEQNANLSETLTGQRPVLEMVDVVLQPFRPPSVLILDFFRKPNNTRKTGSSSDEDDSRSTESNKGSIDDENDSSEMSSSALTSTTESISVIDPIAQDNKQRRRRETHQLGNNSNGDENDDAPSAKSDNNPAIRSSISSKVTGKFQPDDTTTTATNNDDDSTGNDDDDDNGASGNTSANKTGTVKVFLEILQLVPLFGSSSAEDDGSPTTTISSIDGSVAPSRTDENDGTGATSTVIHSSKANSNQKISSTNSTTGEKEKVGKARRAARSATSPAEAAEKGNPSTSSASPSSGAASKPLTTKVAPAAPLPSANASVVKASSTSTTVNNMEGPPLENVTEPTKSDD